jgi:hypothetical protein
MTTRCRTNTKVIAAAILVAVVLTPAPGGAQLCTHKGAESEDQRARRDLAARFVAQVNATQALSQRERGTYAPLQAHGDIPVGFVPRLVFDRWSYVLSLKDLFDPCGFTLFSDERGVVYDGYPRVPTARRQ